MPKLPRYVGDRVQVICPPGIYWVGDPCYGTSDERWNRYCDGLPAHNDDWSKPWFTVDWEGPIGVLPWIVEVSTKYGDGSYPGSDGFMYPVDSGCLGVVPVEYADQEIAGQDKPWGPLMRQVEFETEFAIYREPAGTVHIGHIRIETGDEVE